MLDIDEACCTELEKVRQQPGENIVHYNRWFKALMDDAYPADANVDRELTPTRF